MAGQRQPIDLLLMKGKKNLTKAEIEKRKKAELKANADKVEAPDYLRTKKLKEKFMDLAGELLDLNIMSNLDIDALGRFVFHQSEWERGSTLLGKMDITDDEYDKLQNRIDKHFKVCRQSSLDLGLTISSRCKLVVPPTEEKVVSEFEQKFGNI